ncbi:MAG: hypothetical protein SFX18_01695 [Pirellulales bacterium]|nr:hypothetical protein [Pirellulales bacterium]
MTISYRELKRRYDLDGPAATVSHLRAALTERHLQPTDFSLRDLAESLIPDGGEWVRALDPRQSAGVALLEAGDGVDLTAFLNVTGQIIYNRILDAYRHESFVMSRLVETIPTRLDGEKLPGAANLADSVTEIAPGMPYPHAGFGEDYIETPSTAKRGLIVPVTREAIFFDRTHLVLQRAGEVGEILGLNKEKRLLDVALGVTNNYKWRGASHNTYQTSTPWKNVLSTNELVDWTDIDAAEQLLAEMLDPNTNEPILIQANSILVMPAYRHIAQRVVGATFIEQADGSSNTRAPNPLANYRVYDSRLAYRRLVASGVAADTAKKHWYLGDFRKAFAYMENWPITVTQSAVGSEADFAQDIVLRFKASERGAAAVLNPRCVIKCSAP